MAAALIASAPTPRAAQAPRPAPQKVAPPGSRGNAQQGEVENLFRQATNLIEKDRPKEAIPLLRKALQLAPGEEPLHRYLGWTLMVGGELPAAQKEFETALKLEPANVYSEYFLARTLDMQGAREQALALYEKILGSGNVIYDTYQHLGQAYTRRREYGKALEMIQQALQQTPWDGSLHTQLGSIYRRMGREEEARQEYAEGERLKNADEESIQKLLQLSRAVHDKDTDRLAALRTELMQKSGKDPELMTWLGSLLGGGGYYPEALEPLQMAMAAGPCSYETCYNLGLTLTRLDRGQEAEAPLRKALQLRPHSFEANLILSIDYVNAGQNSEAIESLRVAHRLQPDNLRVTLLLGQQYLQGWYVQAAIDTLKEALRLQPGNLDARYLLFEAYQSSQADEKALALAQETAKLYPEDARAHFEIGHQMANDGHYQEARPEFERALNLDPSFLPARVSLADAQLRNGEAEPALENYAQVASQDPESLDAARGTARCLLQMRRYEETVVDLNKSLPAHPDDGELYHLLTQAQTRLGHLQEASQAKAMFDKLHAVEIARQNRLKPRPYVPGTPTQN